MEEVQTTEPTTSEATAGPVAESAPQVETTPQEGGLTAEEPKQTPNAQPETEGLSAPAEEAKPVEEAIGAPEGDYSTEGIEMPEGVKLDEGAMSELGKVCRGLNLSQKAFTDIVTKMSPVLQARQQAQLEDLKARFIEAGRSDPELGGANWAATKTAASKAYAKFADAETRKVLEATGLNCHPGIIRMFKRIQDQISDDAVVRGRPSSKRDPLANFYNNSNMN